MKTFRQIRKHALCGDAAHHMDCVKFSMSGMRCANPKLLEPAWINEHGQSFQHMSWIGDNGDWLHCLVACYGSEHLVK